VQHRAVPIRGNPTPPTPRVAGIRIETLDIDLAGDIDLHTFLGLRDGRIGSGSLTNREYGIDEPAFVDDGSSVAG
jgi:hypothetical protein